MTPNRSSDKAMLDAMSLPVMDEGERNFARHTKLACLLVITLAIIYVAMDRLEATLIPFVLALALSYLLQPLIDALTCRSNRSIRCRMPRAIAVLFSLLFSVAVLLLLRSCHCCYSKRMQ